MIRSRAVTGIIWVIVTLMLQLSPGAVKPAHGQGSRKDDIVFNSRGVPLAGASIHVCSMPATGNPCSPTAAIYSDPLLTQALANPTTTDGMGNYFFYAAPGQYEIEISGPGITTKQIPNVILPSDPSSPSFSSVSASGGISAFTLSLTGNLTVNGSTSVVGNLASGTLTMTNQATPPGAASAGTVNLYTKTLDKRLYYKDETGTEVGPLATASGAQTNVANIWTAPQSMDADFHTRGPNPTWDVSQFGGYIGPNYNTPTTGTIGSASSTLTVASALDFVPGNGILVVGAGAAPVIATPQAPTVTPIAQVGSTSLSYCVADTDWYDGRTPCSAAGSTSTAFSSFGLQSYTVSAWSSTNGVVTITTSAAHNIPSAKYSNGLLYPQIEIVSFSSNSRYCEGAFTIVGVPGGTQVQITRYGVPDATMNGCSGGTLRVLPRVILSWDSHYNYSVTNAACSGGTATLTISPGIYGPNNSWMVPYGVKAVIAGVSDSHYNTTTTIGNWSGTEQNINYPIVGGTCSGVSTGSLGGTLSAVPGKAVKNHLIYRCSGASCGLPANAANYALVGVATGNDGYFVDNGTSVGTSGVDLGDASATAPTAPTNEYLSTTISNISGTAFTLAQSATTGVTGAKVFHDNTPNLLAVCAAMPASGGTQNGGHVIIPASTSVSGSGFFEFPIMANFDTYGSAYTGSTRTCPGQTTFDFRSPLWMQGTILVSKGINLTADQGSTGCLSAFYNMSALQCVSGFAYPMLYFEPEQGGSNSFQNLVFLPNQPYQSAFYYDDQLNGDGTVSQRYENVHVNGSSGSYPIVDKGGFGRFWNYGGWSASGGNFATQRTYFFTQNCGMPAYSLLGSAFSTYITETHGTYNLGTAVVEGCGLSPSSWVHARFVNMIGEGLFGPMFLFNTAPYGISEITFDDSSYSDGVGGQSTPFYDLTNSSAAGVHFRDNGCGTGFGSLLQTNTSTAYSGIDIVFSGVGCPFLGVQSYRVDNLAGNQLLQSGYSTILSNGATLGAGIVAVPAAPVSCAVSSGGSTPIGSFTFTLSASDYIGGETTTGPSCVAVTSSGQQTVTVVFPPYPAGAKGLNVYVNNILAQNGGCVKPEFVPPATQMVSTSSFQCGPTSPTTNTALINSVTPASIYGTFTSSLEATEQQCLLSSSTPACGSAIDGVVVIPAGSTSVTVNTTAVTAKSVFTLTFDASKGSVVSPAVTCNTNFQQPYITAITPGTSFTANVAGSVSTNPLCFSFHFKN